MKSWKGVGFVFSNSLGECVDVDVVELSSNTKCNPNISCWINSAKMVLLPNQDDNDIGVYSAY